MVEYYSDVIFVLINSHRIILTKLSKSKREEIVKIPDSNGDLDYNFLNQYHLMYLLPIYNYQFTEIIDGFNTKIKWGIPKNEITQQMKAEIPKFHNYLLNAKYSKNYSLWITSCELLVGTSNKLINSTLFHYCVIICKLHSYNPYFTEEYYKLINIRLFLIEFDKYHHLFNINSVFIYFYN